MSKPAKLLTPIHPGEILFEDFMKPFGISMNRLALWLVVGGIGAYLLISGVVGILAKG